MGIEPSQVRQCGKEAVWEGAYSSPTWTYSSISSVGNVLTQETPDMYISHSILSGIHSLIS